MGLTRDDEPLVRGREGEGPPPRPVARRIVSVGRLQGLAMLAARVQGVGVADARAPAAVMTAVRELHQLAGLAAGALLRRKDAERLFDQRIATASAAGRGVARTGRTAGAARALASIGGALGGAHAPCADQFGPVQQVLEAAFALDVRDGNRTAAHTFEAGDYVRDRMSTVAQFERTLIRSLDGADPGGRPGSEGLGDPSEPVLPPDMGIPPPDGPTGDAGLGRPAEPGCGDVTDLCIGLFEESVAALASDPYVDLITSVTPDCLCSDYPPDREFIARPAPGRTFPAPLPADVGLYLRGIDITSRIVALKPDELRFQIPPGSRTGFVYLRGLLPLERSRAGGDISRLCGITAPPDFPATVQQGPAARIGIIRPPTIDLLAADGYPGPEVEAEACASTDLCWRARLSDQPAHLPLPTSASLEVSVHDSAGAAVAHGGAQGCVIVRHATDETFTAVARSFAEGTECGSSTPVSLAIRRVARVHLVPENPSGNELLAGAAASLFAEVSCPAGPDGQQVTFTTNRPDALQLPATVTSPSGETRARVEFHALSDACGMVELRAMAPGHADARLRYQLVRAPVLRWAITYFMPYAPPRARAFQLFSFTIAADCLPQPDTRVTWRLVRTDAGGQGEELPITVDRPGAAITQLWPQADFLFVSPTRPPGAATTRSPYDAIPGLALGTWAIVADVPDLELTSNLLEFAVDLCRVDITLDAVTVVDGQHTLEGELELYMTAVVEPDPPPVRGVGSFLPTSTSLRCPPTRPDSDGSRWAKRSGPRPGSRAFGSGLDRYCSRRERPAHHPRIRLFPPIQRRRRGRERDAARQLRPGEQPRVTRRLRRADLG